MYHRVKPELSISDAWTKTISEVIDRRRAPAKSHPFSFAPACCDEVAHAGFELGLENDDTDESNAGR